MPAPELRRGAELEQARQGRHVAALEGELGGDEQRAGVRLLLQRGEGRAPALVLGDAQPVEVRLDAFVEIRERRQAVVKGDGGRVAAAPQERRHRSVLFDDRNEHLS